MLTASDSGDSLELVSSQPLEGSTWLLARIPGTEPPSEALTLRLDEGTATGEGPCGTYSAAYATDGYFITFTDLAGAGDEDCAALEAEKDLLAALRTTAMLDRDSKQLRLLDARGKVSARFKPVSAR